MGTRAPAHEALIARLHRAGRFLDHLAESSTGSVDYALARTHANTVWQAAGRLDDYATLVDELDTAAREPVRTVRVDVTP